MTDTAEKQGKREHGRMKREEARKREYLPEQPPEKVRRHNRRSGTNTAVIAAAVLFCMAVLGGAGYCVLRSRPPAQAPPAGLVAEANVKTGTLSSQEGRQEELDEIVREGLITFSINATPSMKPGGEANLMIENPPSNGTRFTVTINRDDTGEEIYQSGYLDPEQYIDNTSLDKELPAGEYPCTVYFNSYRIKDSSYLGKAAAKITLYVLE